MNHLYYMGQALKLAETALSEGEFPVGCLLVYREQVVAEGVRTGTSLPATNALANEIDHAEMVALRKFYKMGTPVDPGQATLYCTMEPCLMCYAAILLSGIGTIVYAYEDVMGGGTKCDRHLLAPLYRERSIDIIPHILRDESLSLFKAFFENEDNDYWKNSLLARYTLAQK